jgi:heme-degrading monooxygenase HmoA
MFMNLSNFQPKAGKEAEFKEYFVNRVLPITFAAKGLVSAEVVASADGTITNLEVWESEAAWKDLVADLQSRTAEFADFEQYLEKFWESPVTSLKSKK